MGAEGLQGSLLVLLGVPAALLVAAIVTLALLHRRQQRLLRAGLREVAAVLDRDRDEAARDSRDANETLVQFIGELSRAQQQQLESLGARLRADARDDEERMARMQRTLEERLGAYDRQMERVTQTLEQRLQTNERRIGDLRETLDAGIRRMRGENEQKLEQIRVTVDEKLNATLDQRLGESFKAVSERLEQVYRGLGEMQSLAVGVGDLKRVLTGVKTRGIWGEVQLGALLEQVLAPGQYEANVAVCPGSAERVEFAVLLPGKGDGQGVLLPIDAKFPAEDYQRLLDAAEAGDRAAEEAASKALEATIRVQARRIHDKYIAPPHTTDFAIMFLPVEGLYAEVLRRQGIVEALQSEFRVVITGPTTLLALLNSLQMGFRTIAIEQRTSEVWALLGAVKTEFGKFATLLDRTQRRLETASNSIKDAARKTRTIERKLRDVQTLSDQEARQLIDLEAEAEWLALGETAEQEEAPDDF